MDAQTSSPPAGSRTPDGRFYYDGSSWQAVPLPPELATVKRRLPRVATWLLVIVLAVIGGTIVSLVLVWGGMIATHEVPR